MDIYDVFENDEFMIKAIKAKFRDGSGDCSGVPKLNGQGNGAQRYRAFFNEELKKTGKTLDEMSDEEKREFFKEIDRKYTSQEEETSKSFSAFHDLLKGNPRPNHKYYKRVPDGHGHFKYYYTKEEWDKEHAKDKAPVITGLSTHKLQPITNLSDNKLQFIIVMDTINADFKNNYGKYLTDTNSIKDWDDFSAKYANDLATDLVKYGHDFGVQVKEKDVPALTERIINHITKNKKLQREMQRIIKKK